MEINKDKFYTVQEVAAMFGVNDLTVYGWIWKGKLEAVKVGQWRITGDKLQEYINAGYRTRRVKKEN